MGEMLDVFYYRDAVEMERKTKLYVFIYIGTGIYAVVAYLVQHYFFSIMGENLTTRVRRMMLSGMHFLLPRKLITILYFSLIFLLTVNLHRICCSNTKE
jgi:hypothetical protein